MSRLRDESRHGAFLRGYASRRASVTMFFTLTYKPGFFQTLGFHTVTKETLPPKVWKDCIDCPKFPNCDEIALIREEEGEAPALPKGF